MKKQSQLRKTALKICLLILLIGINVKAEVGNYHPKTIDKEFDGFFSASYSLDVAKEEKTTEKHLILLGKQSGFCTKHRRAIVKQKKVTARQTITKVKQPTLAAYQLNQRRRSK